jgi:hypothetical protein
MGAETAQFVNSRLSPPPGRYIADAPRPRSREVNYHPVNGESRLRLLTGTRAEILAAIKSIGTRFTIDQQPAP